MPPKKWPAASREPAENATSNPCRCKPVGPLASWEFEDDAKPATRLAENAILQGSNNHFCILFIGIHAAERWRRNVARCFPLASSQASNKIGVDPSTTLRHDVFHCQARAPGVGDATRGSHMQGKKPCEVGGQSLLALQPPLRIRLLDAEALQRGFALWAASPRAQAREVIAVDGKTLCGSKRSPDGKRAASGFGLRHAWGGKRRSPGASPTWKNLRSTATVIARRSPLNDLGPRPGLDADT